RPWVLRTPHHPHSEPGWDGSRGHAIYAVLLGRAGVYAEPSGAAHRALAHAVRADARAESAVDRRPCGQRDHAGAGLEAGGIRHGLRRQMASRMAEAVSSAAPRFRPLLRTALFERHESEDESI